MSVVLTDGKNREIRRLFAAIGHEVTRLVRIRIGGLALEGLAAGAWHVISKERLRAAFPGYPDWRSGRPHRPTSARSHAPDPGDRL